jgi:succinate dehydrogenase / fumarate reductase flavoprotein subunit
MIRFQTDHEAFEEAEKELRERINKLLSIKGNKTVDQFHKELGKIMWGQMRYVQK